MHQKRDITTIELLKIDKSSHLW